MGDPAGIGPEIIIKFMEKYISEQNKSVKIVISGSRKILEETAAAMGKKIETVLFESFEKTEAGKVYIIDSKIDSSRILRGVPDKLSGQLSIDYLNNGLELVTGGIADAIVTAPISKDAINLAGYNYSGHTEYLAEKTLS